MCTYCRLGKYLLPLVLSEDPDYSHLSCIGMKPQDTHDLKSVGRPLIQIQSVATAFIL